MSRKSSSASNTNTSGPLELRSVGPWTLETLVHRGATACLYRARPSHKHDTREGGYAVKVLSADAESSIEQLPALAREMQVGREVRSPHLVPVVSAQLTAPPYYLVMPWLTGHTLSTLVKQGQPSVQQALWTARQTAQALVALSAAGWMHGDLKSSNVMISPGGHVTLIDYSLARRPDEQFWTVDRAVVGSLGYMAPETLTSALRPDIRSDCYSLGVVLFEMLTGQLPYNARNFAELCQLHRSQAPTDVRKLAPHLPFSLVQLVRELLATEPLRRPQSPKELVERLTALEIESFPHWPWPADDAPQATADPARSA